MVYSPQYTNAYEGGEVISIPASSGFVQISGVGGPFSNPIQVDFLRTYVFPSDAEAVAIVSDNVTFHLTFSADSLSNLVVVEDVALNLGFVIVIDELGWTVDGEDVGFTTAMSLGVDAGSVAVSGEESFGIIGMPGDTGANPVAGADTTLEFSYVVGAEFIPVPIVGYTTGVFLDADAGGVTVAGEDATLILPIRMDAEFGEILIGWIEPGLVGALQILAGITSIDVHGMTVSFHASFSSGEGAVGIAGEATTLTRVRTLISDAGAMLVSGVDVDLFFVIAALTEVIEAEMNTDYVEGWLDEPVLNALNPDKLEAVLL